MKNESLTNFEIMQIVYANYNLTIKNIKKVNHSSTDCYVIECIEGLYFLKVFNSYKNISKIKQEYNLLNYLKSQGFDVPIIHKANNSNIFVSSNDHYLFVEDFMEGELCSEMDFSDKKLLLSSSLLGDLHQSLNGKYDDLKKEDYWKNLDLDKENIFINSILEMLKNKKIDENEEIVINSLEHKRILLKELKKLTQEFNGITYLMTHGDYSKRNLIYKDGILKAVDFSDSGVYPPSWELIRSYFFSTESCKNGKLFDFNLFYEYLNTYLSKFELNKNDIKYMPYLFMYQILLSRYGYREYIETKDNELLDFVKWKDNIISFLENNTDEIVRKIR